MAAGLAGIAYRWSAGLPAVRQTWPPGKALVIRRAAGGLLVFARPSGNARVTTLVERCSLFLVLLPNLDRRPAGVAERIQAALGGLAQDRLLQLFDTFLGR